MAVERDPIKASRDEGFYMGTIAALACVRAQDCGTTWGEIVRAAGTQETLRHALTHEGDWTWAGFDHYAVAELGRAEVAKARRVVNAARRRNAGVTPSPAPRRWIERWHGSGPDRGWAIWEADHGDRTAYVGEGEHSERLTSLIVQKHNDALGVEGRKP